MSVYQPVREARRMFELRYSEQLPLYVDDIAPWLLGDPGISHNSTSPESVKAGIAEQPQHIPSGPASEPAEAIADGRGAKEVT